MKRILIVALIILGSLLCASLMYNARYTELLDIEVERNTYLSHQISLYQKQAALYDSQIAQYEIQVLQFEDEVDFYKEEAEFWRDEAAFGGVVWGADKLREYSSTEELRCWLDDDPISERKPIPRKYDCDNFAIDLVLSALADGYWIGLGVTEWHMFNFTIIGNDIYKIEARTDGVEPWGTLD